LSVSISSRGFSVPAEALPAGAAAALGTAALAAYGSGWELCFGWGIAAAAALLAGRRAGIAAMVPLLAAALVSGSVAAPLLVGLAAVLLAVSDAGLPARSAALIGGLLAFLGSGLGGLWPYAVLFTLVCLLPRRRARLAALLAGVALAPLFGRMPRNLQGGDRIVQESYEGGEVRWAGPRNLYVGSDGLLLRCPRPGTVFLDVEGGGVRDTLPVGLAFTGSMGIPIRPGRDTLGILQSEGWVLLTNERGPSPGEHPVVRLHGAWSGGAP
jgi:hypothetical protein